MLSPTAPPSYFPALFKIQSLIASIALARRATLVTRNLRHVAGTGVAHLNPF